ncbi:MAG: hypothetical protein R3277_03580 [Brumimicrobium sp.]|nr:hypothetical protein [Brumimicrobium sp.]
MKYSVIQILPYIFFTCFVFGQYPDSELLKGNETPTYEEMVDFYMDLAKNHDDIQVFNIGESDYGLPIYLCMLGVEETYIKALDEARKSTCVFINNAIHPGEPCGVNASMQLALDFSQMTKSEKKNYPVVAILTAYNVGGMKNRGKYSRVNQVGPEEYGFRGNAQNLDLNRDFVKMDSKNMFAFAAAFQALDPDVFVDTHTTNGADYPYTITYIPSIDEKYVSPISKLTYLSLIPYLEKSLTEKWGYKPYRYVNLVGSTPEEGIAEFDASPRYSMGYSDLFYTISFTTEAHMLKPFEDRVKATYAFLNEILAYAERNSDSIEKSKTAAIRADQIREDFMINAVLLGPVDSIVFEGYEAVYETSKVTGAQRYYYDREKPYTKKVPFYTYEAIGNKIPIPSYYIVGAQEKDVIDRLKINGVEMTALTRDSVMEVGIYEISDYKTLGHPYEGHYLHYDTEVNRKKRTVQLKKGDYIISTRQKRRKFIVYVLSPESADSYFNWNFFDSYLQQKEHFSPYLFEETAEDILEESPHLKPEYAEYKFQNLEVGDDPYKELNYYYTRSKYYEKTHRVLPVYFID